jgi:hypothetical protein
MPVHFAIYSTDGSDPTDPTTASDYTYFYGNPRHGEYDPDYDWDGRGSHIQTLGSVVHQDFGVNDKDRKIRIRDDDAIPESIRDELQLKYEEEDTEWHFTDGLRVFRIVFSRRPRGFHAWLNMAKFDEGLQRGLSDPDEYCWYSYEMLLHVIQVVAGESSGMI